MLLVASFCLAMLMGPPQIPVVLSNGITLSKSCTVAAREYSFPTSQGVRKAGDEEIPTFKPAITIRGNNLTVDFKGATLRGTPSAVEPDQRKGLAVRVEGSNITIKNLKVHGYMVGLMAGHSKGLKIQNCDFSYNWKQRLKSTPDKEDESDWQSYHHNEHNEWLRYGAAVYLDDCSKFDVRGCKANGGQCGLMLVRSRDGAVLDNDFSFNSGVGLGLYRSSDNRVTFNKIDWCVRGFSYGVYNRGQDSAGILVFELCNDNVFAFNSVTHGGDGFFLWAGQTMMDTGKGGCNGNMLFGNDFSHSPCNAIEATFSSNAFVNNKLVECWHGIWGGYSFDTKITANVFAFNGEGISIEHGQNNSIVYNLFRRENTAINLWEDPIQDKTWPYAKLHDTASRDYQIAGNVFDRTSNSAVAIRNSVRVLVGGNTFKQCASAFKEAGIVTGSQIDLGNVEPGNASVQTITPGGQPLAGTSDDTVAYLKRFDIPWAPFANVEELGALKRTPTEAEQRVLDGRLYVNAGQKHRDPFLRPGSLRGQRYILVDQWGPYDFKSPILWPREVVAGAPAGQTRRRFEILGPAGKWRFISKALTTTANKAGALSLSKQSGSVPGFVDIDFPATQVVQLEVRLEYVGAETTDHRGITTPAGKPVLFGYSQSFTPIEWDVKFYKWDAATDPRTKDAEFKALIAGKPIKEVHLQKLDYTGGTFDAAVGSDHFATICNGTFTVPAGEYVLELTTDDGARAWVDGQPVITTAWKYQGPTRYSAHLILDGNKHKIRVEHFQIDGYAALKVNLRPGR